MTAKGNPCGKNCPERSVTCHGTCERYAEFWAKCEEARKKAGHGRREPEHVAWIAESAGKEGGADKAMAGKMIPAGCLLFFAVFQMNVLRRFDR